MTKFVFFHEPAGTQYQFNAIEKTKFTNVKCHLEQGMPVIPLTTNGIVMGLNFSAQTRIIRDPQFTFHIAGLFRVDSVLIQSLPFWKQFNTIILFSMAHAGREFQADHESISVLRDKTLGKPYRGLLVDLTTHKIIQAP